MRYLRIGELPVGGRSRNFVTGELEFGVSVYELDGDGAPVVPPDDEWGESTLQMRLASDDPKYVVTGDEAGIGQDGEPIITNVVILQKWVVG